MKSLSQYLADRDPLLLHKLRQARLHPLKSLAEVASNTWHIIKRNAYPHNVVKCDALPRRWTDRDNLMLHAMFQIVVDFVELEQPYVAWRTRSAARFTDRQKMRQWIESTYNTPEGRASFYHPGIKRDEAEKIDLQTKQIYLVQMEIMYLYEWYKDKKYEQDINAICDAAGFISKVGPDGIVDVPNGQPARITVEEAIEMQNEHDATCNNMLYRILAIREHLWT